ncbi:uncharacterized protein LOC132697124 [Cylas formicarius]|uniref:uncharacterized protein LOC132697124 n=1 Tax=Cylas formicarius TaxID=197179 RepID=UPI00295841DE|nr:uncharacterized protein LOC132697124 [Cylas formicarius]
MHLLLSVLFFSSAFAEIIVDTSNGKIRGTEITYKDKSIYAFQKIPFAKAPIGNLRFQAPVPAEPWNDVLDGTNGGPCCIQNDNTSNPLISVDEDCLHINVYTPTLNNTEKLPVMFWIYGGGFKAGCASDALSSKRLVNEGVIIVSANYRLGVYGWLSTGDNVILGNAGFKDQLLALKWTQANIQNFGGDPEKVTIFGESAGAISIGAHIVNKKSAGLYRAAICQSGSSLFKIELASEDNPRQIAYDIAKSIDPTISEKNTTTEIKDFLQSQPTDVLTQAFYVNPQAAPVTEVEDKDAYVTELAFPLLESGNFNQVPLIIGTTSGESLMWYADWVKLAETALEYDTNSSSLIPYDLIPIDGVDLNEVGNIIKEAYVGKSGSFSTNFGAVVEYNSDTMFVTAAIKQAELQSKYAPVYFYKFSYEGLISLFHIKVEGTGNVMHAEDVFYIFDILGSWTEGDILTGDRVVKLWTNFAKTLNPTPDQSDPLLNVTWLPVSSTDIQYLDIDTTLELKHGRKANEFAMWNESYYSYGKQPFIGFAAPVTEVEDEDAYVIELAFPLLESGSFNQVPLIIGTTSGESLMWYGDWVTLAETALEYDTNSSSLIPYDLIPIEGVDLNEVGNIIKEAYAGESAALKQADLQSKYSPVYFYKFSYEGLVTQLHINVEGTGNVMRAEDMAYVFDLIFGSLTEEDNLTGDRVVKLWTNFAKTLNPTPDHSDPLLNVTWLPVSSTDIQYLDIDKTLDLKHGRKASEFDMWNETYYSYDNDIFEIKCSVYKVITSKTHKETWTTRKNIHKMEFADFIVDTTNGKIRGTELTFRNKTIYASRGIPFAKAPLGNLRFQAPVPVEPWEGVLDAKNSGPCCIEMKNVTSSGLNEQEDCLNLNVYTPTLNNTEKLPVMFWIYGGGFISGCSTDAFLSPYKLVNEDVVIVTSNYRLGGYGWLSTGDNVILGNAGFKDQLLALQWTQKNIQYFGGDPEKVTIFGESAGGVSVGAHIVNKKSAGLYRAAICQSGCSLLKFSPESQDNPKQITFDIAKSIDATISEKNTTTEIKDFLQSQPADVLTQAFFANPQSGPVIEVEDKDAYVTELAFPILDSGNFNQVPLIIGTTSGESLMFYGDWDILAETALEYDTNSSSLIPYSLIPLDGVEWNEVGNIIKEAYVGKSGTFSKNFGAIIEYNSDTMFVTSSLKQAELQSKYSPVYFYEFSYEGLISLTHIKVEGTGNVSHAEDIFYIFELSILPLPLSEDDALTADRLVRLWTNFAKTLNPTPDESDPLLNVTWLPVSSTDIQYLDIDTTLELKHGRKANEFAMWNDTFYKYGKQPFIGF